MVVSRAMRALVLVAVVTLGALFHVAACGPGAKSPVASAPDLDADPLALLPGSAVLLATLDARAMFASAGVGAQVAALTDALLPLGAEAGFDAKRDVDRVVLGVYTSSGVDVAAVVSGRFDEAKIAAATQSQAGNAVVRGMYAGRVTYAVGPAMYSVLSAKTVAAGTADGMRRLLERVRDASHAPGADGGTLARAIPSWMDDTQSTPGAQLAAVADLTSQPVAAAAVASLSLPWLGGIRTARVIGNFEKPGMNLAATLSYDDASQAASAADGVRGVDGWLRLLGPLLGGLSLQNLDVATDGKDAKCKFALDDRALARLLGFLPLVLRSLSLPDRHDPAM
jgi:hypothetical protein